MILTSWPSTNHVCIAAALRSAGPPARLFGIAELEYEPCRVGRRFFSSRRTLHEGRQKMRAPERLGEGRPEEAEVADAARPHVRGAEALHHLRRSGVEAVERLDVARRHELVV